MRIIAWITLGSIIVLYLFMRESYVKPSLNPDDVLASETRNREALRIVRDQPQVKQALITDANVLYVSVVDDGEKKDVYAKYLCGILEKKKANVHSVKVVKLRSLNERTTDTGYGVVLGESNCQ